jgi:rod shape determining protein RodA
MKQYQRDRFIVLFDASYKLNGVGYHQLQSTKAIANGGFWGQGLYNGTITQFGHLPAKQTDFIFSVACEELGFFGGFLIIAILTAIIIKCVVAAISMRNDRFSMLISHVVASMLTFQAFINIGMNLRLAPVVGLTLPFISAGGTSIITMFAAIGVVATVKKHYVKRSYSPGLYDDD